MGVGGRIGGGARGFLTEEEKKNRPKLTKELLLRILSYLKPKSFIIFLASLKDLGILQRETFLKETLIIVSKNFLSTLLSISIEKDRYRKIILNA